MATLKFSPSLGWQTGCCSHTVTFPQCVSAVSPRCMRLDPNSPFYKDPSHYFNLVFSVKTLFSNKVTF